MGGNLAKIWIPFPLYLASVSACILTFNDPIRRVSLVLLRWDMWCEDFIYPICDMLPDRQALPQKVSHYNAVEADIHFAIYFLFVLPLMNLRLGKCTLIYTTVCALIVFYILVYLQLCVLRVLYTMIYRGKKYAISLRTRPVWWSTIKINCISIRSERYYIDCFTYLVGCLTLFSCCPTLAR